MLPVVVVVGLGPAGPELMTGQAREALAAAPLVLVRTARHGAATPLLAAGARALDAHYEASATFEEAYGAIVEEIVTEARLHRRVAYAVPGSPLVLEASVAALRSDGRVTVELVAGMSFLDLAWQALAVDPVKERVRLIDAERFARDGAGDTGPLLVSHLWSRALLSEVKLAVETFPATPVVLLHHLGHDDETIVELPWERLDQDLEPDHLTCLWIPELAAPVAAELVALDELVHVLRARCPWDAEQTHASLARHLLEEAYEAVDAIDELGADLEPNAVDHLEEELGDVLCQVLYHAVLAGEEGLFTLADVARTTHDKLVGRHPHVFGDSSADSVSEVVGRWEKIKQEEKGRTSITEGIPNALPSLALAGKLERKAKSVSLGWDVTGATSDEVEALAGAVVRAAGAGTLSLDSLGVLLLSLARLAAARGLDADDALRGATRSLRDRLQRAEEVARDGGTALLEASPEARLQAWLRAGEE